MSFLLRSRANSEADGRQQRDWISQAFTSYPVPIDLGRDIIDPISGNTIRIQYRYLGNASVKSGSHFCSNAMFYEIAESELTEISFDPKKNESNSSTCSSDEVVTMATSEITPPAVILDSEKSPMALPPKKRKRRRVIRYEVIFCLENSDFRDTILDSRQYYLFPREAIVESLNDTPPLEASVSFHLPKGTNNSILHSICSCHEEKPFYASKLEEFAAVCTNNDLPLRQRRRFTDPGLAGHNLALINKANSDCHVLNIQLSGISKALYIALKQTVSDFESVYGKMIELMKLHSQQISAQKLDLVIDTVDEEDLKFTNMITQGNYWTSDEDEDDQDYIEQDQYKTDTTSPPLPAVKPRSNSTSTTANGLTKKCLYCGSRSTPMWRRGPQGAGTLCNACGVKWKHGKILCGSAAPPPTPATDKVEKKKRKYHNANKKEKRGRATAKKRLSVNSSTTEDMDYLPSSMTHDMETATRSLNLNETVPSPITGDYFVSPSSSFTSTSTSPPLLPPIINHQRRHTTDMSLIEKFGLMNNTYALTTAGVDAVEAAAVLTLLKRS